MEAILDDLPFENSDEVLVFVNGMGGTTLMELLIVYGSVAAILRGAQHHPPSPPRRRVRYHPGDGGVLHLLVPRWPRNQTPLGRTRLCSLLSPLRRLDEPRYTETLYRMYRTMLTMRRFDERVAGTQRRQRHTLATPIPISAPKPSPPG